VEPQPMYPVVMTEQERREKAEERPRKPKED